ncbi:MAG: PTS sugar transporter subunit IIA [Acetobacteraceae bacterium]|nr:PTS sugar transporter subunit IIA [Acetobacteraceae bacterium]
MIGLVLVTHGRLAEELRLAMEHVVGPQRAVATVCIGPDDDVEDCRQVIRDRIAAVEQGDGVVVLTDILGGTPCNLAVSLADKEHVDVIAGVNLPLLVKLAKIRGSERLADAVDHAAAAGRKYISAAGCKVEGTNGVAAAAPNGAAANVAAASGVAAADAAAAAGAGAAANGATPTNGCACAGGTGGA